MRMRSIVITAVIATAAAAGQAAGAPDFTPTDIRGAKVGSTVLWAHVFHRARPTAPFSCLDADNSSTAEPGSFTEPRPGQIRFSAGALPGGWETTLGASFDTWNTAAGITGYFGFGAPAPFTMSRPSNRADGTNYMGLAPLGGRTLAVTYTWSQGGSVVETGMFFNSKVSWGALPNPLMCPTGSAYDIESIATHELGHSLGFDHISDVPAATMYPTAPAGETRKRTLTNGEKAAAAGAFLP